MKFPAYVPAGARAYITRTLEGNPKPGWKGILAIIAEFKRDKVDGYPLDVLEREAACMKRFAHDERMQEVYGALAKVFTADKQYADFLRLAEHVSQVDFNDYRDRVKQVEALAPKIAEAAETLRTLLVDAGSAGAGIGYCPDEFFSIRALLEVTDSAGRNLHIWRGTRDCITGRSMAHAGGSNEASIDLADKQVALAYTEDEAEEAGNTPALAVRIVPVEHVDVTPEQEARNMLGYAWEKAPDLPQLLTTVADAARKWRAEPGKAISAAIASRKRNRAKEYVRAFARALREQAGIDTEGAIVAAIAEISNIALNSEDVALTADDVRKALALRLAEDSN